ncbi:MAG: hypothetical protein ABSF84_14895 [Acidimicrobiales bacterium]|jgi:hypothetical protein
MGDGSRGDEDRNESDEAEAEPLTEPLALPEDATRTHRTVPSLVEDSGVWVWMWVIGGIVLLAIIIVVVLALPSRKGMGPTRPVVTAAAGPAASPDSAACPVSVRVVPHRTVVGTATPILAAS